jgi:phosphoserine aminotransferase
MFEHITIPKEILPKDGRFGCGPSLVRPEFLESLVKEQTAYLGTSHRQATVKNRVGHTIELLRKYLEIPADYKVAMGDGSASLVWDMTTFSLVEKKSVHFTAGEFASKWFDSVDKSKFVTAAQVKAPTGEIPAFKLDSSADVHCVTWNETSTGAMMPGAPDCNGSLLAVDATSAAGALWWDLTKTDFFYFSPQKAFGSEGGLWIGIFSPKCVEQIQRVKKSGRYIPAMLDFDQAITNGEANQTYNTPSLTTIYLLEKQLEWFLAQGGIRAVTKMQKEKKKLIDAWVERRPELTHYVKNPEFQSETVCTINLDPAIQVDALTKHLRKFGIRDIDCYRKLGQNQIRVSIFPNVSKDDLERLTKSIDYCLDNKK